MDEIKLTQMLESFDLDSAKIEEIVLAFKDIEKNPQPYIDEANKKGLYFDTIKKQMSVEDDWRKKAALAARLISIDLE